MRVPNLRVCKHLDAGWHMQGEKGELSAWQKTSSETQGGRTGLFARVTGRHVVRESQSSPGMLPGEQARLVKTVKNSGEMDGGDTLKAPASDQRGTPGILHCLTIRK